MHFFPSHLFLPLVLVGMIPAASPELLGLVQHVVEEEDEASEEIERRERNHQA